MCPSLWDYLYLVMTITVIGVMVAIISIGIQLLKEYKKQKGHDDD